MKRKAVRFDHVVVPLDGSRWAEHALPIGATIAGATGAKLRLVLVHTLPPPPTDRESLRVYTAIEVAVRKAERGYLRQVANKVRAAHGVQVASVSPAGPPGPTLVGYIDELGADLVVMATHGRGAIGRALLGSVADHVVRTSSAPVLLVRPDGGEPPAGAWSAKEVLVPLDGSPLAERALGPASDLARALGARLSLVQIVVPIAMTTASPLSFPLTFDEPLTTVRRDEAQAYLDRTAERLRAEGLKVDAGAVVAGSAAGALVDLGRLEQSVLLVIASRGRGGVRRLALGSVADKLVRAAEVPVLVVRPGR